MYATVIGVTVSFLYGLVLDLMTFSCITRVVNDSNHQYGVNTDMTRLFVCIFFSIDFLYLTLNLAK